MRDQRLSHHIPLIVYDLLGSLDYLVLRLQGKPLQLLCLEHHSLLKLYNFLDLGIICKDLLPEFERIHGLLFGEQSFNVVFKHSEFVQFNVHKVGLDVLLFQLQLLAVRNQILLILIKYF